MSIGFSWPESYIFYLIKTPLDYECYCRFRKWLRSIFTQSGGPFFDVFRAKHPQRSELLHAFVICNSTSLFCTIVTSHYMLENIVIFSIYIPILYDKNYFPVS